MNLIELFAVYKVYNATKLDEEKNVFVMLNEK